jgi:cytochrome c553
MPRLLLALLFFIAASAAHAAALPQDGMAQRTLACTACHGKEGRAGPDGYYPRIAGKPAGYLYNQLLHFRDGRRHYGLMTGLLDTLSDEYLLEIARYFAALDAPYPPPAPTSLPPEQLQRGRQLAQKGDKANNLPACAECHGRALTGVLPAVPGLLGLPRDYLNAQLGAWRSGQRRAHTPDCMADIARRLSPEDLAAVTGWLAAQPVPRKAAPARAPRKPPAIACGTAAPSGEEAWR